MWHVANLLLAVSLGLSPLSGGPGSSHQAQKCQQAKLTGIGIGIGREKRFWRFVIDKSATVEARTQSRTVQSVRRGRLPKCEQEHFAEFHPEGWLLLALDLTRLWSPLSGCVCVCVWVPGLANRAKQINSHLANPLLDDKTSYIHMQIVSYE